MRTMLVSGMLAAGTALAGADRAAAQAPTPDSVVYPVLHVDEHPESRSTATGATCPPLDGRPGGPLTRMGHTDEAPFLAEARAAMVKMMASMDVTPSGDVDADLVAMMVAHHQGAIDMARAQLRYGHNEQLRRLAQEIIVTQQQEIAVMRLALGEPLPASVQPPPIEPNGTRRTARNPARVRQEP